MKATKVLLPFLAILLLVGCNTKKKENQKQNTETAIDAKEIAGFYAGVYEGQAEWGEPIYLSIDQDGSYQMIVKEYGKPLTAKALGVIAYTKGNEAFSVTDANGKNYTFKKDGNKLVCSCSNTLTQIEADTKTAKAIASLTTYQAKVMDDNKDVQISFEVVADADHTCLQNVEIPDLQNLEGFTYNADESKDGRVVFTNESYRIEILHNKVVNCYDLKKSDDSSLLCSAMLLQPLADTFTAGKDGELEVNYFTNEENPSALVMTPEGKALFLTSEEAWAKGATYHNDNAKYTLTYNNQEATVINDGAKLKYTLKK